MNFPPSDEPHDPQHSEDPTLNDAPQLRHRRATDEDDEPARRHAPLDPPRTQTWARTPRDTRNVAVDTPATRLWIRRALVAIGALSLIIACVLLLSAIALRHAMHASLPQLDGTLPVAGLSAPVTVTRDAQGVPSIHAANLDDLLFAQGFVTASDRLFQMDALRRHGAGTLAEILGPSLVDHDREQRILQLRTAADRAAAALPPDQLHQLQAYARGVNAFIDAASSTPRHPNTLPVEFHILHYTPAPWTPSDTLLVSLVMAQNLATEFPTKLNREALAAHLPANLLSDLYPSGSWRDHPPTQTPTSLTDPSAPVEQIPLDNTQSSCASCDRPLTPRVPGMQRSSSQTNHHLDRSSRLFADAVQSSLHSAPRPTRSAEASAADADPRDLFAVYASLHPNLCESCRAGSNNWTVSGVHSATNAPLLSNDMHLGLTAPDIWYEAGLHVDATPTAADLDVTGFTLPGAPFVIVGRNAFVAWSFTNSGADVQDVIIEHLRGSGSQTEFERPDHTWAPVGHQIEHIAVRGGPDQTVDVLTTTHTVGNTQITIPIISPLYKSEHRALALEWTIYDPSTVSSAFLAINSATDAASLIAACSSFTTVSQNLVYADAHHIGYHLLGRIPVRGPATQQPRATQPFIVPDTTPSEDEDDESGDPQQDSALPANTAFIPAAYTPGNTPSFLLASARQHRARRRIVRPTAHATVTPTPATTQTLPTAPVTAYTIGSPISPVPIDALDASQIWSGYIPYDALPAVLDPSSGIVATANARIVTDDYPYFIANNWVDAYRVERINHLLTSDIASHSTVTPADMLAIQTDVHSEFDLLLAQRLAYALDHSPLTKKDPRLQQAANLLRDWNGNVTPTSPAAAIVAATRSELWPMLLAPKIRAHDHSRMSTQEVDSILDLYTWEARITALESILQHTPARWLPKAFANWDDFLTTAVSRGLRFERAPAKLSTWSYGSIRPVEIPHPIFGSDSLVSKLLGVPTGSGLHPNGGDDTTVKAAGLHFGPSERFTADLANPDNTHANITTGESGNPSSPWFLDQFLPWLNGTTFTLPLIHPQTTHTLTLTPQD
jgi:penicillin amidase